MHIYIKATQDRQTGELSTPVPHPSIYLPCGSFQNSQSLTLVIYLRRRFVWFNDQVCISIFYYELGRFAETAILAGAICEYRPPHASRLESWSTFSTALGGFGVRVRPRTQQRMAGYIIPTQALELRTARLLVVLGGKGGRVP